VSGQKKEPRRRQEHPTYKKLVDQKGEGPPEKINTWNQDGYHHKGWGKEKELRLRKGGNSNRPCRWFSCEEIPLFGETTGKGGSGRRKVNQGIEGGPEYERLKRIKYH